MTATPDIDGLRAEAPTQEEIAELRRLCERATPGPWAFEGTSEKANDYMVGVVCPVDAAGNPGPQISGNVQEHPHYFNPETNEFGEWYCEGVAQIDEGYHGADASCYADAAFIAAARDWLPRLSAEVARLSAALAGERAATMERIRENSLRATAREAAARAEERAAILHDAEHIRKLTVKSDTALETIDSFINAIRARGQP